MPNDEETKKKWRVRTWAPIDRESAVTEAEQFENALNELSEEKYEIYEVSFDKRMIVGRLEEEELEMPPSLGTPPPMPQGFSLLLQDLLSRRRPSQSPQQQEPDPTATDDIASPAEPPMFVPEGKLTNQFFGCLNTVISAKMDGDPHTEKRVVSLIQHFFKGVPMEEAKKCLSDTAPFPTQHQEARERDGAGCGDECVLHTVFTLTEEKLKAHLAANPAN